MCKPVRFIFDNKYYEKNVLIKYLKKEKKIPNTNRKLPVITDSDNESDFEYFDEDEELEQEIQQFKEHHTTQDENHEIDEVD